MGEEHSLGLRMVADVFDGAGFDVKFVGTDVKEAFLLAWVAEHPPTIVALGVTMPQNAAALLSECRMLRDYDPAIRLVVGGQGVPDVLEQGAGVFYFADTEELVSHIEHDFDTQPAGDLPDDVTGHVGLPDATVATAPGRADQARRCFSTEQHVPAVSACELSGGDA